ncbi:MAG: hypothetical protein P0Y56_11290 [Candidatus Andeanibacterium colombiense]|uniref:Uncharacterized protein n=1 Tax=Candidatus Andeanibacterium colombiense TaxID=3121345 RepID=A0AAJ5X349_9SPHN|nr:MAG: hypothetical protein P0Y56_11290 [Sphingomonadaceae bacterium]
MLRARKQVLEAKHADLKAQIQPVVVELDQIEYALRALTGKLLLPTGADASMNSVAHFRRKANPDIQNLTFQQLVVKALSEHLTNGATANELLDFFRREWGKEIMRTSLSPQLSRLKADDVIELRGKVWHLVRNENEPPQDNPKDGSETALDAPIEEATE